MARILSKLLIPMLGQTLTVTVKNDRIRGRLSTVGRRGFIVGDRFIEYSGSFYIIYPKNVSTPAPSHDRVTACLYGIGPIMGCLIQRAKDYIMICTDSNQSSGMIVVAPINSFTQVTILRDSDSK